MSEKTLPPHIVVRENLMAMQRTHGGMIDPFALRILFHRIMQRDKEPNSNHLRFARDVAQTYCALANEMYLLNYNKKRTAIEAFYVTEERWAKYCIDRQTRELCFEYLCRYGLISCETKTVPPENKTTLFFSINLKKLNDLRAIAENESNNG